MPTSIHAPALMSSGRWCGPGMLSMLSQVGPNRSKDSIEADLTPLGALPTRRMANFGPSHFSSARLP